MIKDEDLVLPMVIFFALVIICAMLLAHEFGFIKMSKLWPDNRTFTKEYSPPQVDVNSDFLIEIGIEIGREMERLEQRK